MRHVAARRCRPPAAFLAASWLLILLPALAQAQASPPRDTVRAGVLLDWPPYYSEGRGGAPQGFAIDVFNAVAVRARFVPRYVTYPSFTALQAALERGDIDVIPNLGITRGREVLFTEPVNTFDIGLFVRRSSPHIESPAHFSGEVAVVQTNVGVQLAADLPGASPVLYYDVREALFRLLAGDVDGLIFPSPVIWSLARSANVAHLITDVPPALAEVKRAIAVTPGREDLLVRLDREVHTFLGTPQYAAIFQRWHQPHEPFWTARRVAIVAGIVIAIVLIWAALVRYATVRRARERIRFHAHLLDVIGEAVIAVDLEGRVQFWNRFAEQLYGWKAEEAVGRPVMELITPVELRPRGGEIIDLLRRGQGWQGEFTVMHRDGRTFQALVTNQPIFGPDGRVTGMVGVSSDLTERKNLEQQLMQAQKMESIGRLAGGIAHDFNNLLTVIKGTTEVVMAELPAESRHRADLVEVRRAAQRAADLTQHLLAFSRRQVVQPQVIDLNEALRDSERMLRRVMGEDVTVEVRAGQDVGAVRIDPAQLQQVILNLAVNSRDAMPRGGRLTVETSRMTIDPTEAARHAARRPGEWVQITVTDTGSGMDEATRRHAFEPFFTTKGPGRGTGLGLATVYGIVQQGGGSIELESAPGAGTTFRIHLPRVAEAPPANGPAPPPPPAAGSETILVVEDERAVRELVVRKLDMAGYRVLVADDPSDALHIGRTHQGPIHLLLTDVVMPGMDGPALAAKLAHVRPEARVLYITGYAEGHAEDRGLAAADAPLLMKPFDLDTLARTVRQVLDAEVAPGRG